MLVIGFGQRLVARIAALAKAQNITSVADFVAARYGKAQNVAAMVALIALIGAAPYIALQLKAIAQTMMMLVGSFEQARLAPAAPSSLFFLAVALLLAAFAMAFGTRRIDPTEHQDGLILAIAAESLVKLVAFLAVGAFVVWGMFGGLGDLARIAQRNPANRRGNEERRRTPAAWIVTTILSALAILLLPRQFHVTIVENRDGRDIKTAAWLFPLYLVAINLFVAPLAIAGLATFADGTIDRDLTVLALPLSAGAHGLALLTMIGGLSAATAMVVVESVALSINVSNDLVMPLVLRGRSARADARGRHRFARAAGAARRDPVRAVPRLCLYPARQPGGARLARLIVFRCGGADRARLSRRPVLAARQCARRHGGPDRRLARSGFTHCCCLRSNSTPPSPNSSNMARWRSPGFGRPRSSPGLRTRWLTARP